MKEAADREDFLELPPRRSLTGPQAPRLSSVEELQPGLTRILGHHLAHVAETVEDLKGSRKGTGLTVCSSPLISMRQLLCLNGFLSCNSTSMWLSWSFVGKREGETDPQLAEHSSLRSNHP